MVLLLLLTAFLIFSSAKELIYFTVCIPARKDISSLSIHLPGFTTWNNRKVANQTAGSLFAWNL